jgi:hypothetical protein
MKKVWNWIKDNPNRSMFLLPILLVAAISISHVVSWYDMANPINWAIYLSIAIEVAAITALVAATNKIKGGIWFMFGIVTFIQMVGNIFYSFKEIDETGELFKSWIELTGPVWELMGTETTDLVGMKRWLAFLEGGLLPIISLTSLHFFVKYEKPEETTELTKEEIKKDYYEARNRKMEEMVVERENLLSKESKEVEDDTSEISEEDSKVVEEESKAERVKAPTSPFTDSKEDEEIDDLPPNEVLENALKKYKETRGEMEKLTPNEVKDRIVNQPPKPPKTNIKRID